LCPLQRIGFCCLRDFSSICTQAAETKARVPLTVFSVAISEKNKIVDEHSCKKKGKKKIWLLLKHKKDMVIAHRICSSTLCHYLGA
jgi:hypothetical protein